jgi:hypothetical protein
MCIKPVVSLLALAFAHTVNAGEPTLVRIQEEVRRIQSAVPSMHSSEMPCTARTMRIGVATAYTDSASGIRRIKTATSGNLHIDLSDYYFLQGELIFASSAFRWYLDSTDFSAAVAMDSSGLASDTKPSIRFSEDYYFEKNKMIRYIGDKGRLMDSTDSHYRDTELWVQREANELVRKFK